MQNDFASTDLSLSSWVEDHTFCVTDDIYIQAAL